MLPGAKGLVYRSKFLAPGNFFRDGFGDNDFIAEVKAIISLNPCFSGGWSQSNSMLRLILLLVGLNPCFSGGWSQRATSGSVCQRDCYNDVFNFVNVW